MSAWLSIAGRAVVVAVGRALVWMFGDPPHPQPEPARASDDEPENPA